MDSAGVAEKSSGTVDTYPVVYCCSLCSKRLVMRVANGSEVFIDAFNRKHYSVKWKDINVNEDWCGHNPIWYRPAEWEHIYAKV